MIFEKSPLPDKLESVQTIQFQERANMLGLTCVPPKVYDLLYPFKPHFGCPQARHFVLFCWLLVGLMLTPDKGTLKGVSRMCRRA